MRKGIGIGSLLLFSFVAVMLIPVISVGYYSVELHKRDLAAGKDLMVRENRKIREELLRDHVDRTIRFIRDRITEAAESGEIPSHEDILRNHILRNIGELRFGESGRVFVLDRNGVLLGDSRMKGEVRTREDRSGNEVYSSVLKVALADSAGGYAEYSRVVPGKAGKQHEIVYVRSFPEWGWIVCAGELSADMDTTVALWESSHRQSLHSQIEYRGIALASALFISLLVSFLFSRLIRREFTAFFRAFESASLSRGNLDTSRLNLREFIRLSGSVNRLLRERDEAEDAARHDEQFFRAIVEDIPGLLCRFRPDGVLTYVNDEYCRYFGRSREELLGSSFFALIPEEAREGVRRQFHSLTPEHPAVTYEHPVFAPNGESGWQRWTDRAIFEGGAVQEYQSYGEDITDSKRADASLRASEEKFARMFRLSPSLMLLLDASTRVVLDLNDACSRILGLDPGEAIGWREVGLDIWVDPEEREWVWEEGLRKGRLENREVHIRNRRGEVRTGLLSLEVLRLGERDMVLIVVNDITSLEQTRADLRESERRIATLVDNLPGLAYRCRNDEFWTFEYASEGALEITGYSPVDLVGNHVVTWETITHPEDRTRVRREIDRALREDRPYILEYRILDRAGTVKWVWEKGRGISGEGNGIRVLEGFMTDITERKEAEAALRESEERFRSLVETSSDWVWEVDTAGKYTYASPRIRDLLGYEPEEILGKNPFDFMLPGENERVSRAIQPFWDCQIPFAGVENTNRRRDGMPVVLETNAVPVFDRDGVFRGYRGIDRDITERKKAEAALRESEERFRSLVEEGNGFPIQGYDRNRKVIFWNTASEKLYGYTREEALGRQLEDLIIPPEMREGVIRGEEDWVNLGIPVPPGELDLLHKDGSKVPVFSRHVLFRNRHGEPEMYCLDMSLAERRQAEDALRQSEEKHRILLDESSDPIFSFEPGGTYTYVNRAFADGVGKPVEQIIGNRIWDVFDPEEAKKRYAVLDWVFRNGKEKVFEVRVPRPDGDRFYVTTVTPVKNHRGDVLSVICSSKEITERVRADAALREEKERLTVTLRSIGDGVITTDRQGNVLLMNRVAEELTGWTQAEAEGRPLGDVFHIVHEHTRVRCENPVDRVLAEGGIVELANHTMLIARGGREIVIADSGAPILDRDSRIIGVVLVFRDVTIQKRMEDELLRMEKLESVGVLAGGIAHDFNNLLTGVLGAISVARLYLGADHAAHDMLLEAEHQSLRARDLTVQLLTFSQGGAPVRITASIVETVRETVNFTLHGSKVRAEYSLPDELWAALVDLNQLSHVINNLALNSVQAMPDGGCIEVEAHNTEIGENSGLPLSPGKYILLSFRDTGVGIPREHLHRIFDPYFTTKEMGSGLGLATSWSIIKRHDGHIRVESEVGAGTVFHLYLPATGTAGTLPPGETERIVLGQGRVLVMDDDEGIRKTASMLLEALGYSTATVNDGAAAVEAYCRAREKGAPFDAVIMDLTVPGGVGGLEAVRNLRALDPAVRAVVSSGYSTDPIMAEYTRHGFVGVLVKPYRAEDISRVLRKVLGEV